MTPQKKTSHHIFKMAIFSKFFGDVIILIIRANADKRIKKNSDIFSIKNLEYTFVCFLSIQSLCHFFFEYQKNFFDTFYQCTILQDGISNIIINGLIGSRVTGMAWTYICYVSKYMFISIQNKNGEDYGASLLGEKSTNSMKQVLLASQPPSIIVCSIA